MTRKDLEAIAAELRRVRPDPFDSQAFHSEAGTLTPYGLGARDKWLQIVGSLTRVLAESNSRFDSERFKSACGA